MKEAAEQSRQIIQSTIYAAIATSTRSGIPWNSPVFVAYDDQLNFYWASTAKSQHSKNISENPNVFLTIFNSEAPWGLGEGVYIKAKAAEVTDLDEITKACGLRYRRVGEANQPPSDFTGALPRRIYRATPEQVWINTDATQKGYFVDTRREVNLAALRANIAAEKP